MNFNQWFKTNKKTSFHKFKILSNKIKTMHTLRFKSLFSLDQNQRGRGVQVVVEIVLGVVRNVIHHQLMNQREDHQYMIHTLDNGPTLTKNFMSNQNQKLNRWNTQSKLIIPLNLRKNLLQSQFQPKLRKLKLYLPT